MNIILLGPPGSGKGTQGKLLAEQLNLPRLSVGALLRHHFDIKTPLGSELARYTMQGQAIPGDILMELIKQWINEHKNGFIIDNLIRTTDQLNEFKKLQQVQKIIIDKVFYLLVNEEESVRRLKLRRKVKFRHDETPKAIRERFHVFQKHIDEIVDYFNGFGILCKINGEQSIEKVHQDIMKALPL